MAPGIGYPRMAIGYRNNAFFSYGNSLIGRHVRLDVITSLFLSIPDAILLPCSRLTTTENGLPTVYRV